MSSERARRLIIAMTGASGAVYGVRLLESLRATEVEVHLVLSRPAERTLAEETDVTAAYVRSLADVVHQVTNIGAAIASGSFRTAGMIIAPCSVRAAAAVAYCMADNLITRAADVCLKERRRLVLLVRETPLHQGHLKALLAATEAGAIVMPPVPAFYARPRSVQDIIDHTVGRMLDLFDIEHALVRRWGGDGGGDDDGGAAPREPGA